MAYDQHGRAINYIRISLTDRCNLRCLYCMPEEGVPWKPHDAMLSLEEIERFVRIAATEGFSHVRLTGGEPLVRLGVAGLICKLLATPGIESIAMTTNGILLPKMAHELREAGLKRVNISLDTLDAAQYTQITRWGRIEDVFAGIDAALEAGFKPVKINAVVVRSLRQDLLGFARLSVARPLHIRFIEYMPVGDSSGTDGLGWTTEDTIPNEELIRLISQQSIDAGFGALIPLNKSQNPDGWGPARYYQFEGAQGTVGFISALSRHFCEDCNRVRMTAEGKLRPCLFSDLEYDVRTVLREGNDVAVRSLLRKALATKPDQHHNHRGTDRPMSQIGG